MDPRDPRHDETVHFFEGTTEAIYLSPFVLAEADHFIAERVGVDTEVALLADVARSAFILEPFLAPDVEACMRVILRYRDLDIRVADASVVVLAGRHGTTRIVTFDERHFRALRSIDGRAFALLPADEA